MDVKFDMESLMQQMKDYAIMGFVMGLMKNEKDRKMTQKACEVFMKHNIPIEDGMQILAELGEALSDKD